MTSAPQEREHPTSARVLLVNHGETEWTHEERFAGVRDVALSEDGRRQGEQLARRLAGEPVAAVYTSPLRRAVTTAELIAEAHQLPMKVVDSLREMDFGDWEGRTRGDVMGEHTVVYGAWSRDPATVRPPRGESGYDVETRAVAAIKELARAHQGETIVVVGHRTVNRIVLCQLLGINLAGYRERLAQDVAALNRIEIDTRGRGRLYQINDTVHLHEQLPAIASTESKPPSDEEAEESPTYREDGQGATGWLIPYAAITMSSADDREQEGYDAIAVVNTGSQAASVVMDLFFEERAEVTTEAISVAGQRVKQIRLDRGIHSELAELPGGLACAVRVRSDHPVVVQHVRVAADGASPTATSTMAHPLPPNLLSAD